MPADKYSFKAVDSIRSFAQQMLHLAFDNVNLITVANRRKKRNSRAGNLENSPTAQTKDSVVSYVTRSYDFAIASRKKNWTPTKYGEITGFGKLQVSRFRLVAKGLRTSNPPPWTNDYLYSPPGHPAAE